MRRGVCRLLFYGNKREQTFPPAPFGEFSHLVDGEASTTAVELELSDDFASSSGTERPPEEEVDVLAHRSD